MKMKKFTKVFAAVTLSIALTTPVMSNFIPTATIVAEAATPKISKAKITLELKETTVLKVTNATQKPTWTSSNSNVASVGKTTGKVTGKKVGTATITGNIGNKKYTCKVTVTEANQYKKITERRVSLKVPTSWEVKRNFDNSMGIKIYQIDTAPKDEGEIWRNTLVVMTNSDKTVDAKAYKKSAESPEMQGMLKPVYVALAEMTWGIQGLEALDMKTETYKDTDMVKSIIKIGKDGKEIGKVIVYQGIMGEYVVQSLGIDLYSDKSTPTVEEVAKNMIDTIVIK